jgi:hypothetical protein
LFWLPLDFDWVMANLLKWEKGKRENVTNG